MKKKWLFSLCVCVCSYVWKMKYNKLLACEKKNFQKTKQTNYYVQPQKCSTCSKTKIKNLFFDISSLVWCVCVFTTPISSPPEQTNKNMWWCDEMCNKEKTISSGYKVTHTRRQTKYCFGFLSPHSSSFKRNQTWGGKNKKDKQQSLIIAASTSFKLHVVGDVDGVELIGQETVP
jgi:hypothetical protein